MLATGRHPVTRKKDVCAAQVRQKRGYADGASTAAVWSADSQGDEARPGSCKGTKEKSVAPGSHTSKMSQRGEERDNPSPDSNQATSPTRFTPPSPSLVMGFALGTWPGWSPGRGRHPPHLSRTSRMPDLQGPPPSPSYRETPAGGHWNNPILHTQRYNV